MADFPHKTYPCQEHGEVSVPLTDLIVDGELDIFPEVTGKGYFDIDYRRGELHLVAKSFVGLIPINRRVCVHVLPRLPVNNVLYLVQRAHKALAYLPGYYRSYKVEPLPAGELEELFGNALLDCLLEVQRGGLMHRYVGYDTDQGWRGRILIGPTVARHIAKGYRFRQTRRVTELTANIPANQVIKEMLTHLIRYFSRSTTNAGKDAATRAKALFQMFDAVSWFSGTKSEMALQALTQIRTVPADHKAYERILWLCYLLVTRQGLSIEAFGPARVETMVVNLADVFEAYVREVINANLEDVLPGSVLRDGNRYQVSLFAQGGENKVKPDIYLLRPKSYPVVMDAKYKPSLRPADRYEALAFCEALQSKLVIFISPSEPEKPNVAFHGRTPGGIEMHEVRVELASPDIFEEEKRFVKRLHDVIESKVAA